MTSMCGRFIALMVLLACVSAPAAAQSRALVVFAHGSHVTPLSNLSDTGDDLAPAFSFGGGVGIQLGKGVALRADATLMPSRLRGTSAVLTPEQVRRLYVFGDLQIGWPGTSNMIPYILVGAGAVHSSPKDPSQAGFLAPAGRIGAGANYLSGLGVFYVEGMLAGSKFSRFGFSSFQLDLSVSAGVALAIPF